MDREAMIEAEIAACTGCGGREFPKRSDCPDCIAAVDARIAEDAAALLAQHGPEERPDWSQIQRS